MNTGPNTIAPRLGRNVVSAAPEGAAIGDWAKSDSVDRLLERLDGAGERWVARAPGRLDLMGGSAEYTGSLVLNITVDRAVYVAVQLRDDGVLSIDGACDDGGASGGPVLIELERLQHEAEGPPQSEAAGACFEPSWTDTVRTVAGTLAGLLRAGVITGLDGGLSVAVASTLDGSEDLGVGAALGAATAASACAAMGTPFDAARLGELLISVGPRWFPVPLAPADLFTVLSARSGVLNQVRCDPCAPAGVITLPDGIALAAVDCGSNDADAAAKYVQTRAAVMMGLTLIDCIIRHEGPDEHQWDRRLSRVSMSDYVKRFRDRIPTKLAGAQFLDRFGVPDDPWCRIEPGCVYKVRSRTEHHIYEHARTMEFGECLSRACRTKDSRALAEAGELMYASHWSYGQRCGYGSIVADTFVSALRHANPAGGVFGAKITGNGGGRVLAVLLRDSDEGWATVKHAIDECEATTECTPTILHGSLPGVFQSGIARV